MSKCEKDILLNNGIYKKAQQRYLFISKMVNTSHDNEQIPRNKAAEPLNWTFL